MSNIKNKNTVYVNGRPAVVIRAGEKNSRVMFEDGTDAKVPNEEIQERTVHSQGTVGTTYYVIHHGARWLSHFLTDADLARRYAEGWRRAKGFGSVKVTALQCDGVPVMVVRKKSEIISIHTTEKAALMAMVAQDATTAMGVKVPSADELKQIRKSAA